MFVNHIHQMSAPSAHPQVGPIALDVDGGGRIDAINTILLPGLAGTVRMTVLVAKSSAQGNPSSRYWRPNR